MVDDNPADATLLRLALEGAKDGKYEIEFAESLATAIVCLESEGFDIVFLDLGLPDSVGVETVEKIFTVGECPPVIVLTGMADSESGTRAVEAGAQDYLVKGSFDTDVLARAIRYAMARHRVSGDLREAAAHLEQVLTEQAVLVATTSHDVRSSLATIVGFADMIHDGTSEDRLADSASRIARLSLTLAQNMGEVTENIRARMDSQVELRTLYLRNFLVDVVEQVRLLCERKGLDLRTTMAEDVEVSTDPRKLQRIVLNLLTNAARYTCKGQVTLDLEVRDAEFRIRVTDTGIGIEEDQREHIFEEFTRLEAGQRLEPRGTGLGLAVVRRLTSMLGGRLRVESEVGVGTSFEITLPIGEPAAVAEGKTVPTAVGPPGVVTEKDHCREESGRDCPIVAGVVSRGESWAPYSQG